MFLLLNRLTKRLLEKIDDFFPSTISLCTTSSFFLSWLFFNVRIFFSSVSRFSRIDLCSNIFSRVSATISSASFEVSSGWIRVRVADFIGSTEGNWTVELPPLLLLPPPLATALLLSEVLCSADVSSTLIWFEVLPLVRCLGLLVAVSVCLISFLSVPTEPGKDF